MVLIKKISKTTIKTATKIIIGIGISLLEKPVLIVNNKYIT